MSSDSTIADSSKMTKLGLKKKPVYDPLDIQDAIRARNMVGLTDDQRVTSYHKMKNRDLDKWRLSNFIKHEKVIETQLTDQNEYFLSKIDLYLVT